jgi:hypothetical protein
MIHILKTTKDRMLMYTNTFCLIKFIAEDAVGVLGFFKEIEYILGFPDC